jgi:hypothetical protein
MHGYMQETASQFWHLLYRNTPGTVTPWCRVLLEKLTGSQLVKKFPTFFGTRRFITAFTSAHHLSLSSASSIQSMPHIPLPEDPYSWFCTVFYILRIVLYALIWYYKVKLQFKMNTL